MRKPKYEVGQLVDVRGSRIDASGLCINFVNYCDGECQTVRYTDGRSEDKVLKKGHWYSFHGHGSCHEDFVFPHNKPADDEFTQDFMKLIQPKKVSETA